MLYQPSRLSVESPDVAPQKGAPGTRPHVINAWQIGHFINPKCDLIFGQNAPNMSTSSIIRQECFRIDLRDSEGATARGKSLSRNGSESIGKRLKHDVCCTKRECWAGAQRKGITMPTSCRDECNGLVT